MFRNANRPSAMVALMCMAAGREFEPDRRSANAIEQHAGVDHIHRGRLSGEIYLRHILGQGITAVIGDLRLTDPDDIAVEQIFLLIDRLGIDPCAGEAAGVADVILAVTLIDPGVQSGNAGIGQGDAIGRQAADEHAARDPPAESSPGFFND